MKKTITTACIETDIGLFSFARCTKRVSENGAGASDEETGAKKKAVA